MKIKAETGIILARGSTDDQEIQPQIFSCKKYAEQSGIKITDVIGIEGESAFKGSRKEFNKVYEKIQQYNEPIALIFDSGDRFTRQVNEQKKATELRKTGCLELHCANEELKPLHQFSTYLEESEWYQKEVDSFKYSARISSNILRKFDWKLELGEYPGYSPTGYKNKERKMGEKSEIIEDPVTKDGVLLAFQMRAKEIPFDEIVTELNDKGYKVRSITGKLKPYKRNTLQGLLSNSFYIGEFKWRGEIYSNQGINRDQKPTYPLFISRELFDKVQEVNEAHKHESRVEDDDLFLKSLLRCGICGTVMVNHGGGNSKRGKKTYKYYRCSYTKNPKDNGNGKRTACGQGLHSPEKVNEFFGDKIINTISHAVEEETVNQIMNGLKQERLEQDKNLTKEIKKLKDRMIALEDEKKSLTDKITALNVMGEKGKKMLEAITEKFNELCDSQTRIEEQIDKLENSKHDFIAEGKWLLNHLKTIMKVYSERKGVKKLQILESMISKIELNGTKDLNKAVISWKTPFDFLYDI